MITLMVILTAMLAIPTYIILYMFGGPGLANKFRGWFYKTIKNIILGIIKWVGKQAANIANRHQLATGLTVAVLLVVLFLIFSGHFQ